MRRRLTTGGWFLLAAMVVFGFGGGATWAARPEARLDTAWWRADENTPPESGPYHGLTLTSQYLTMRDGVKIAVDVYLPAGLRPADKLPTILDQTRYWRRLDIHWPASLFFGPLDEIRRIVEAGYALVRVDVRGSGASFGQIPYPWNDGEVRDGAQVVDWIVAQPWSDGQVGAAGGSYEGTTAEFLSFNRHPAVKAIAPMFALFDVYTDIAFPGGIQLSWFTREWERGNRIMDRNRPQEAFWFARLLTSGVAPVDGDRYGEERARAVAGHRGNVQIHQETLTLNYRDDVSPGGICTDRFSPHTYSDRLRAAGIPVYNISGWFDGAYPHAAVKRFLTVENPGSRLLLGPWDHGGADQIRPFDKTVRSRFDLIGEVRRFFDFHLKGKQTGIEVEPPVHYYTMVADRWRSADHWPPPARETPLYLAADHRLSFAATKDEAGRDDYHVDPRAGTGSLSRYNALAVETRVAYPDRKHRDRRLLYYQSAPLPGDLEVTGHPLARLFLAADAPDAQVFVYLEDVNETGEVSYVTEGMLRALHRQLSDAPPPYRSPAPYRTFLRRDGRPLQPGETAELVFDLQPVSYLFRQGHAIRVAIAGADADHFRELSSPPTKFTVQRNAAQPSRIVLPVVEP
ncbi:MAG: CocE/NonD family hydrolase [Myxococcales bacterium]|nr:CocE/NonD family hydrolase [Myxococcales bacterium]